jgi:hypothetical protein
MAAEAVRQSAYAASGGERSNLSSLQTFTGVRHPFNPTDIPRIPGSAKATVWLLAVDDN